MGMDNTVDVLSKAINGEMKEQKDGYTIQQEKKIKRTG
jgi:hypothetical protein